LQVCILITLRGVASRPIPVVITNRELDVNVENSPLDVNVKDHWIIDGDPIPVRVVR